MKIDIFDINKFINVNGCKEVTNSFYIGTDGKMADDGLFSTSIFGQFGSVERKYNFGYIDLKRKFFHPFVYIAIQQMFRALPDVILGKKYCKLDSEGSIITSDSPKDDYETGISFFINNWKKINWVNEKNKDNKSKNKKQDLLSQFSENEIFIDKWLVLPAWYRDINIVNKSSGSGNIEVEGINLLYNKLLITTRSTSIMFSTGYVTQASIQNILVEIHTELNDKVSGKTGIIRQAVMGKSVDYSTIGVISLPKLNSELPTNQTIPFNTLGIPLHLFIALFYPFVIKGLEDLFYDYQNSLTITLKGNKELNLSDIHYDSVDIENIKKMVKSYTSDKARLIRTQEFKLEGLPEKSNIPVLNDLKSIIGKRPLTLTDVLYAVCLPLSDRKKVLATRYPVTGAESTIINNIKLMVTEDTISIDGHEESKYFNFPYDEKGKILVDKIKFVDTYQPNVSVLSGMGEIKIPPLTK